MVLASLLSSGTSTSSLVDQVEFLILLLIVTLIVALLSRRLLVIVGSVVGLFPFLPNEHIDPNPVFYVFIPALLFEGAWNAEIDRLEADWLPIVLLAIPGLVLWPIFGGLLLGFSVGWAASHLLRRVDDRLVVITVTVAVAYGMYLLGTALRTSGLLAVVGAGLVIGSYGRMNAMSPRTIEAADDVWEFITYLANSLLFLLLGFELASTNLVQSFPVIFFGLLGAVIGRVLMIYAFMPLLDVLARWWARRTGERRSRLPRPRPVLSAWRPVMVISGLRGALSLALVLGLPTALEQRNLLTDSVYGSILVTLFGQGLTLRVLLPRWKEKLARAEVEEPLPTQA